MVSIEKDDYRFLADVEKTKSLYHTRAICTCVEGRNFYAQVTDKYPELTSFLADFGVDIRKPDGISWMKSGDEIDYEAMYTMAGKIEADSPWEIDIGFLNIVVDEGAALDEYVAPCFRFDVFNMILPWILDEPFPEKPHRESIFAKLQRLIFG